MTRRLISNCMPALALAGAILLSLPPRADAELRTAISLDGGPSLFACDNVAAGGACATGGVASFSDTDPAVGTLETAGTALGGDITVNTAIQTSVKSPGGGGLNTLSSSGTVVQNTGAVAHDIVFIISDTSFVGPSSQFTATGSGTWVDQTLPVGFGGSTIEMNWWNDPANAQGAQSVLDTPGNLVFGPQTDTPANADGSNQSFSFNSGLSPLGIPDPGLFSMTLGNELTLGPGIRLESRGQAESKPTLAVPAPATLLLLGSALALLGWRRRGSAA